MALALGKVEGCPFDAKEIEALKNELVTDLEKHGLDLGRKQGDREDLPIDFRFVGLLLKTAEDPEIGLGDFAQGVRVGPGSRMPRLPALYRPKRRWRLASQTDPRAYLDEEDHSAESAWRRNYATVQPLAKEVYDVLDDQTRRGMFIRLPEQVAKEKYPNLVVASLGANRKDRPNGEVTARVLHDGTNGLAVNTRTRLRDQERSPISADLKRGNAGKGQAGLQHVCSYGRCERGASPDPYRPEGLALARLSNWSEEEMSSLTPWGHLAYPLRHTTGPESPVRSVD